MCDDNDDKREGNNYFYLAYYSVSNKISARVVVKNFRAREKPIKVGMQSLFRVFVGAIALVSAVCGQEDVREVQCEYRWGGATCDCLYSSEVINLALLLSV